MLEHYNNEITPARVTQSTANEQNSDTMHGIIGNHEDAQALASHSKTCTLDDLLDKHN